MLSPDSYCDLKVKNSVFLEVAIFPSGTFLIIAVLYSLEVPKTFFKIKGTI